MQPAGETTRSQNASQARQELTSWVARQAGTGTGSGSSFMCGPLRGVLRMMPQRRAPGGTPYRARVTRELERAIASQPDVLRAVLELDLDGAQEQLKRAERVLLVGTGTSHHAAILGAQALARAGVDARAFASAEYAQWPQEPRADDALIVISH